MALKRERSSGEDQGVCKISISEDMTIYAIDVLKQELSEEMDICTKYELDLSYVEEIDSAGIQLLLAFKDELMRKKKGIKLTAMSSIVTELMDIYGVSSTFNISDSA